MITREEAAALLAELEGPDVFGTVGNLARTVVALYDALDAQGRAALAAADKERAREEYRRGLLGRSAIDHIVVRRRLFSEGLAEAKRAFDAGWRATEEDFKS